MKNSSEFQFEALLEILDTSHLIYKVFHRLQVSSKSRKNLLTLIVFTYTVFPSTAIPPRNQFKRLYLIESWTTSWRKSIHRLTRPSKALGRSVLLTFTQESKIRARTLSAYPMLIRSELSFLFPYTFAFLLLSSSPLFIYLFSIYYIYNSLYFHWYVSPIHCNNNGAQNLQLFGYWYRENSCSLYFLLVEFYKRASKFHRARACCITTKV